MHTFYRIKISLFSLLMIAIQPIAKLHAQSSLYTFSASNVTNAYQDISTNSGASNLGVFQTGALCNNDSISPDIPLNLSTGFAYNCRKYFTVKICNNGFLILQQFGNITVNTTNAALGTVNVNAEGIIQPMGTSLVASTNASAGVPSIKYANIGADFVVQYSNLARSAAPNDIINFQVLLSPNGTIRFIYGICLPDANTAGVFVAIRTNHFSDGKWIQVPSGNSWSAPNISGTSGIARFTSAAPATAPSINTVYQFSPRTCPNPSYKKAPFCANFENNWIDTLGSRPDSNWTSWPARGNGGWARQDALTANWGSASSGLFTPNGANSTSYSARFHSTTTPIGVYGDLNAYVDFSNCPTANKELSFYYINTAGSDSMNVFISTTGPNGLFTKLAVNGVATKLTTTTGWTQYTVPLGAIGASNCVIRFRAVSDLGNITTGTDIGIDEICFSTVVSSAPLVETFPNNGAAICGAGQGIVGANLLATGGISYSWTPSLGLSSAIGSAVLATPAVSTTYTVTGTDANCNTATSTISVTVSPLYNLSLNATNLWVCNNGNSTLTINDTIYGPITMPSGYCPALPPINNIGSFCITNVDFGTINNTSFGTCGTSYYTDYSNSISTNVFAGGTYGFTGTMATANGSMSVWIDFNRNGVFETTEYTSIVTGAGAGNPYTQNIVIPANALPGITLMRVRTRVTSSGITAADACTQFSSGGEIEDYAVRIIKSPNTVLTIGWLPTTFLNSTNQSVVTASNITATTTYTATITDASGCNTNASITIGVLPLTCSAITANPLIACVGGTSKLQSNVVGGGQPYSYIWYGPNISNNATIAIGFFDSVLVTPTAATVYTLQVTDACGNTCSQTFTLTVFAPPVVNVTNPNGGGIQICATNSNNVSLKANGADSYVWSPATNYVSAIGDSVNIANIASTSYVVTGTDANGCTSSTSVLVPYRANYPYTMSATPPYICPGGTSSLRVSDTVYGSTTPPSNYCITNLHNSASNCIDTVIFNGYADYTSTCNLPSYTSNNATYVTTIIAGQTANLQVSLQPSGYASAWLDVNQDGVFDASEYYALIINATSTTFVIPIPINSTLGLTRLRVRSRSGSISASEGCSAFADGETQDYLIRIAGISPSNIVSYSWTPTAGLATNNGNPVITNPVMTTTPFIVVTTDANGCTKQSAVLVNVAPLSCSAITNSLGSTICSGVSTTLTANHIGGGPSYTYSWQTASGNIGNTKAIVVAPITTTTYTVTVQDGCSPSASCTRSFTIIVNTSPTISLLSSSPNPVICGNGSVAMNATGGINYSWLASNSPSFLNGNVGPNALSTPLATTIYSVIGIDANGCTSVDTMLVRFSPASAITATANPGGIGLCNSSATLTAVDTATGPQVPLTLYCNNSIPISNTQADITNFTFGTINNTSTCTTTGAGASILNKYSDFTTIAPIPDVYSNTIENFSVSVADCGGVAAAQIVKVFIDFNRNNSFADAYEEVYVSPAALVGAHTESGNIFISNAATAGVVKMRVIVANTNNPNSFTACGNYASGETEDYLVNIIRTPLYPYTYTWNPNLLTGNNVVVSPTATTTYTVLGTDANGCTAQNTVILTVGGVACNAITASASTVCDGDSTSLTANPILGTPPYQYAWSNGATSKVLNVSPIVNTTYTVITTDACNATCSATITINVTPKPTIYVNQSLPIGNGICVSGTNTLIASSNASGAIYSWQPATNLNTTTGSTVVVSNPTASQVYTVTVTNNLGCTNTASFTSLFSPSFSITASASLLSVCPNGSSTLAVSDTVQGVLSAPTYAAIGTLHTSTSPCIIEVAIAGTYTNNTANVCALPAYGAYTVAPVATVYAGATFPLSVTTTNNSSINPCTIAAWIDWNRNGIYDSIEWVQVASNSIGNTPNIINITPPAFVSAGYARMRIRTRVSTINGPLNSGTSFASGETEDYLIHIIRTDIAIPNISYSWAGSLGSLGTGVTKVVNNITANTAYTVTATNTYGCTSTSSVAVNVQILSAGNITGNTINCEGKLDTLIAHPLFGGAPYTYSWASSVAGTISSTFDSNAVVNLNATTTFTVTISDACNSSVTKTFTVNFVPVQNFFAYATAAQGVCGTGTVNITTSTPMNTYAWTPTNNLNTTNTASVNVINPIATTTYTVLGTDGFGCTYTATFEVLFSNPITVTAVSNPLAICAGQSAFLKIIDTFYGPTAMPTNYCGSSAANSTNEEILNVQFGTINNTSDCFTPAPGPGSVLGQYANYTVFSPQTFYSNNLIPFSLLLGSCNGSTLPNGAKILIDFNRDGDFFDAGELAYTSPTALSGTHTETGIVTVPNVVSAGYTRVRVIMSQTANPNTISNCGLYSQGETEEYIINLVNTPTYIGTTYSWSAGTTPNTGSVVSVTPTANTTYTVTMANAASCTATSTVNIVIGPLVAGIVSQTANTNSCIGNLDTITANPSGGGEPYHYLWSNGDTNKSIVVVIPASVTYTVTISDACNNTVTTLAIINSQPPPPITINAIPSSGVICVNGSVNLTANCATCATVNWINTNQNIANISASPVVTTIYTVAGTDGYGCTGTATFTINKSFGHIMNITSTPPIACINNSITLSTTDSTINSTFDPIPTNYCLPVHSGSSPCIETVIFSNMTNITTNSCILPSYTNFSNKIANIIAGTSVPISVKTAVSGPGSNASISIWIDFNRDGVFSIGEYQSITTSVAPNTIATANINIPNTAVSGFAAMRIRAKTSGTANGATNSCTAFASGETEDYVVNIFNNLPTTSLSYQWSPVAQFSAPSGNPITTLPMLANTTFTVIATDANNCTFSAIKNINVNPPLVVTADTVRIKCYGYASGTIHVNVSGGVAPFSYSYSPSVTSPLGRPDSAINVLAGTYTITVNDANGCSKTVLAIVAQNPNIVTTVSSLNGGCFGVANASAYATVIGGVNPYSYLWLDGLGNQLPITNDTAYNLSAGTYTVFVNDANGCYGYPSPEFSFTVSQPLIPLAANIVIDSVIKCFNGADGVIRMIATGGSGNYTYKINNSNFQPTASFIGLSSGTYTVTVKDNNLCTLQLTITLANPAPISLSVTPTNPLCNDGNGTILITVSGGTGTITTKVNGAAPLASYVPNNYTIFATDAKSCFISTAITITAPPAIVLTATASTLACNGDSAIVTITATGGTGVFTKTINNNALLAKYVAATYAVKVADANGCSKTTSLIIANSPLLVLTASATNPACNGDSATVTVTSSGGTGLLVKTINNLAILAKYPAGTYAVKVVDANGCSKTTTLIITAPPALVLTATATAIACVGDSATVTVVASGGTGTLTKTINNSPVLAKYAVGTYTVKVVDINGCSKQTTLTITSPPLLVLSAVASAIACNGDSATVTITSSGGTGSLIKTINNLPVLPKYIAGTYAVKLVDANGCSKTTTLVINTPSAIVLTAIASTISCNGDSASVTITASGGTGSLTKTIDNLPILAKYPAGTYTVKAVDGSGCINTTTLIISAPSAIVLSVNASAVLCNGDSATVTITSSGGTSSLTNSINLLPVLPKYIAGNYTVKAVDANGCSKTTSLIITEPTAIVLTANATTIVCNGDSATVTVTASGGNGTLIKTINNLPVLPKYIAGTYAVKVVDANGCIKTTSLLINTPSAIVLTVNATNIACNGDSAIITVIASGGTNTITKTINNLPILPKYSVGTYTINAVDGSGCSKSTTVSITMPSAIVLSAAATTIACNGDSAVITIIASGGTGTFVKTINNQIPSAKYAAGTYTIKVVDGNGCSKTISLVISEPNAIILNASASAINCNGGSASITVFSAGGVGTLINTVNNASILPNYAAGTYTIKATDSNSCSKTMNVTIVAPATILLTANASNILCNGDSATITVTASGGTGGLVKTIDSLSIVPKYSAGSYYVKVVDANGCSKTTSLIITDPLALVLSANASAILCNGDSAAVTVTASGGSGTLVKTINNLAILPKYASGTYAVKVIDANGCSATTTLIITAPPALVLFANASAILCNSDSATVTVTASGGNGTLVKTINNLPINLKYPAGTYALKVIDSNGCIDTSILVITAPTPLIVQANGSAIIGCGNQVLTLTGSGATTYTWTGGVFNNTPFVMGSTASYTVVGIDGNNCTASSSITINIANPSNNLTLTYNVNDSSVAGNGCKVMNQIDGSSLSYYDATCDLIAKVADANGGNVLGTVTTCVAVNGAVQIYNLQPFVARTYTITPTNQGAAIVTLYFTHDDIMDYNEYITNNNSTFPKFNNIAGLPVNGATITNASITKLAGGGLGVGAVDSVLAVSLTYDAANARWECTFGINSFSSFYLHTLNPNMTPLNVNMSSFTAEKVKETTLLHWITESEVNNAYFVVHRSSQANGYFEALDTVNTKAINGNSKNKLSYYYTDSKPLQGINYYRLLQVDVFGKTTFSKIVSVFFNNNTSIIMYPNPVSQQLNLDINATETEMASIKILDITGRIVKQIETQLFSGNNTISIDVLELPNAIYQIKMNTEKGNDYTNQFIKK